MTDLVAVTILTVVVLLAAFSVVLSAFITIYICVELLDIGLTSIVVVVHDALVRFLATYKVFVV